MVLRRSEELNQENIQNGGNIPTSLAKKLLIKNGDCDGYEYVNKGGKNLIPISFIWPEGISRAKGFLIDTKEENCMAPSET